MEAEVSREKDGREIVIVDDASASSQSSPGSAAAPTSSSPASSLGSSRGVIADKCQGGTAVAVKKNNSTASTRGGVLEQPEQENSTSLQETEDGNEKNGVVDLSREDEEVHLSMPVSMRKTPRKVLGVEKYTDSTFLSTKKKKKKKMTPKISEKKKSAKKSSGTKRKSTGSDVEPIATTVENEDGTKTTTSIKVDHEAKKTIITTTNVALDGTQTIHVAEVNIPQKKASQSNSNKKRKLSNGNTVLVAEADEKAWNKSVNKLHRREKIQKDKLANMKKLKLKLEKVIETQSKIKFPIEDSLIAQRDAKGKPPVPLPPVAQKLIGVPDLLAGDVLYVWDFITVFSKELNLKTMMVDDFVELLRYRSGPSPALVETFVALLRCVLRDHQLSSIVTDSIPSHLNIMSRTSEDDSKQELLESQQLEQYCDWDYVGKKFLPKKVNRPETFVDSLKFQSVLRSVLPLLPSYVELLRANDPQLDTLISMENREGVDKDGYKGPNRDTTRSLMSNYAYDLHLINEALLSLENQEIYQLDLQHKLQLLMHLCRSCLDTAHVRHLLARNQEERQNQLAQMTKHAREERKKLAAVDPKLRELAVEECRAINRAKGVEQIGPSKSKGKDGKGKPKPKSSSNAKGSSDAENLSNGTKGSKNRYDPSPAQLSAMIEDLKLRQQLNIDVIIDNDLGIIDENDAAEEAPSIHTTARASLAEFERKRKEREKLRIMKEDASAWLSHCLDSERERDIREALKFARKAELEGTLEDGQSYCTAQMLKVYRKRAQLEAASKEAQVVSDHEKALAQYYIRTEPIGYDRHHRAYWCFDGDSRIFVQTTVYPEQSLVRPVNLNLLGSSSREESGHISDGDSDDNNVPDRLVSNNSEAATPLRPDQAVSVSTPVAPNRGILLLNGKTSAPSSIMSPPASTSRTTQLYRAKPSSLSYVWRIYGSMMEIWMLIEALDERGIREKELKSKLRARFGFNKNNIGETYQTTGSEFIGRKIRRTFGKKVAHGTIVGWLPPDGDDEALWHVVHDDGDEEDLDLKDIELSFKKAAEQACSEQELEGSSGVNKERQHESDEEDVPDVVHRYKNTLPGALGASSNVIGIPGLRGEFLRFESMFLEGLRKKGSSFHKEGKRHWEHSVKMADTVGEFRDLLITLEGVVHETQKVEDEIDSRDTKNKKEIMSADGWIFETLTSISDAINDPETELNEASLLLKARVQYQQCEEAAKAAELEKADVLSCSEKQKTASRDASSKSKSKKSSMERKLEKANGSIREFEELKEGLSYVQRRVRRFFEGHGISDGTIVGFLPSHLNEGVRLWHLEHDDGDTEDLDLKQVKRASRYYDLDAQEADEDDVDEEEVEEDDEGSTDRDSEDSETESEEDEDVEDGKSGSTDEPRLWPSQNVRTRWIRATRSVRTVADVSLALHSLVAVAKSYGVVGEDPLAGSSGNRTCKTKRSLSVEDESSGKRKRDFGNSRSRKARRQSKGGISRKSSSKKNPQLDSSRGPRSLMDRAAKRCVMSYAEE